MKTVQRVALVYLLVLVAGLYGYAVGRFHVFPYSHLEPMAQELSDFARGDAMEQESSALAKLTSDLGLSFGRWLYDYPQLAAANTQGLDLPREFGERIQPLLFVDQEHRSGYRVIVGILDLPDSFWGALLLDPQGRILHTWKLTTEPITGPEVTDRIKNLYGIHVFPDGSVIFNMQEAGGGIVKVDACSNVLWNLEGSFHHTVSPDESGNFWSFIGGEADFDQNMVLVSQATGEILRTIDIAEVRRANPDLRIWDLYPSAFASRDKVRHKRNLTHGNDIEPLPAALASEFPQFEAGDLVLSYATTNLIFVMNPDTLEVKWWRVGLGDLQHDPDWESGGVITLFSNNSRRLFKPFSDIVTVDPATMAHEVGLHGEDFGFMSRINGRHQLTPFGTRMVTSSTQGWAFEVDGEQRIVFSFVNSIDAQQRESVHLADAFRFQEDYFQDEFWHNCDENI